MKIKKRGIKTQLVTLSVLLMTFLSSFSYVNAFGYSIKELAFTHGEVTISTNIGNEQTVYSQDSTDIINYLQFTFDAYYTGTVKLNYTYGSSNPLSNITDWNVIVIGGTILTKVQSTSSSYITFQVTDRNEFTVIMTYNMSAAITSWNSGTNPVFNFTSASSSLSAVTNHNNEYNNIAHIDAQIVDVNTNLASIISKLTTANGFYLDILANTNDIETYLAQLTDTNVNTLIEQYLGNIQLNLASMYTQQQTANTTLSSIYSSLGSLDPNSSDVDILSAVNLISTNIGGLAQNVQNLYARVNEINSNVSSIKNTLSGMQQDLSSLLTLMNNIDNTLDTISWNRLDINYLGATTDSSNYDLTAGNKNSGTYFEFDNITINYYTSDIIHVRVPLYVGDFANNLLYLTNSSVTNSSINYDLLYYYPSRRYTDFYFRPGDSGYKNNRFINGNVKIRIISNDKTIYQFNNSEAFIETISQSDIEYWKLLNYFSQIKQYETVNNFDQSLYNRLGDIIDAINNIQVTVNVTEQQITNITNNFDVDIDVIHNVENNYKIDFDGWNNQLPASDLSLDLTPYNSTVNFMKNNITSLWSNPFVNLPIIVSCLCFVFMVILG